MNGNDFLEWQEDHHDKLMDDYEDYKQGDFSEGEMMDFDQWSFTQLPNYHDEHIL